jgi:hypothetical protein
MIANLDPTLARNGEEGKSARRNILANYTCAAMYLSKTSRCIGILASADQEGEIIDWCFLEQEWEYDEELEKLASNAPFAPLEWATSPSYYILKQLR